MGTVNIDRLIEVVSLGGTIRTGVDIYNRKGVLLLEKDVQVDNLSPLLVIKKYGVGAVAIDTSCGGGMWDQGGKEILEVVTEKRPAGHPSPLQEMSSLEQKVEEIAAMKREAAERYESAKGNVKTIVDQIAKDEGRFDYETVDQTVTDLVSFLSRRANAFSYLTREIFSYDEYLFNHSINVCVIATAVLRRFNDHFGDVINKFLVSSSNGDQSNSLAADRVTFIYYLPDEIHNIAIGYLLHDVGKVMVPDEVLNKNGPLSEEEYEHVRRHSWEFGAEVLHRNGISNPYIENTVKYHHAPLYNGEPRCYPDDRLPIEIAPYVKIGKLADIYDAMTSKRCYRDAVNPIEVVTDVFRSYANKNRLLQFLLYSFVKVIGIYPPGSILYLRNGQMAYVLDSTGPLVLPVSDQDGNRLPAQADPIDLGDNKSLPEDLEIDRRRSLKDPKEVYEILPDFLHKTA